MTRRTNEKRTESAKFALRFLFLLPASLFFFFSVFFFPVTETYLGNSADYTVPFSTLAGALLPFVCGGALLVCVLAGLLPARARVAASAGLFLLGLVAWVQSVFLNGRMISMTGETERYSIPLIFGNLALILGLLSVGVIAVVILFRRGGAGKIATASLFLSLLLLLMQGAGTVFGAVADRGEKKLTSWRYLTAQGETTLSSDRNVVVFLLDYTPGNYLSQARDLYPDLFDGLDGFTLYPDALPRYTRTYPSIPYLLTGVPCEFDLPYSEYANLAGSTGTFLPDMKKEEISIGVYTNDYFIGESLFDLLENASDEGCVRTYSSAKLARASVPLALKRVVPYLFKSTIRYDVGQVNVGALTAASDAPSDEEDFYGRIREEGLSLNQEKGSFRFFHFMGPHPGTRLRADATFSDRPTSSAEALKGDFTIISAYISELKRLGVYDKTTIVITTDHAESALSAPSGKLDVIRSSDILMMVKPAEKTEGFDVSEAMICHDDLFATVYDGLGLDASRYGNPIYGIPTGMRMRTFYYTALFSNSDGEIAQLEYEVAGNARNVDNYNWTGNYRDVVHSFNRVSKTEFTPSLMEADGE